MSNIKTRSFTAVFIVVFVLGGFLLHPVSFLITAGALLVGTQYEYLRLVESLGVKPARNLTLLSGLFLYLLSVLAATGIVGNKWLFLGILPVTVLLVAELYRKEVRPFDSIAHSVFSLIYIAVPFSFFPFSAFGYEGIKTLTGSSFIPGFSPSLVAGFLLLLWLNDTGAYLVGISVGRHRLLERISPKKSWEGFFGGMIFSVAAGWFVAPLLGVAESWMWAVAAVLVSVGGTFGDLSESMLKRSAGVKDSGTVLPGHGGFLDRFDSTLVSFPLVCLWFSLFG